MLISTKREFHLVCQLQVIRNAMLDYSITNSVHYVKLFLKLPINENITIIIHLYREVIWPILKERNIKPICKYNLWKKNSLASKIEIETAFVSLTCLHFEMVIKFNAKVRAIPF